MNITAQRRDVLTNLRQELLDESRGARQGQRDRVPTAVLDDHQQVVVPVHALVGRALRVRELAPGPVQHLLGDIARPSLPDRQLHGMLKGFADLVFEHEGRFWVLDYKSTAAPHTQAALCQQLRTYQAAVAMFAFLAILMVKVWFMARTAMSTSR